MLEPEGKKQVLRTGKRMDCTYSCRFAFKFAPTYRFLSCNHSNALHQHEINIVHCG
jgi:hypothetical protein